jgi:2-hydroxymuconate-semialdehyde hydrolase
MTWQDSPVTDRTPEDPGVGRMIDVAGIRTNVLVSGDPHSSPAVLLIHGSGPGVSAYSSWRLTMPALAGDYAVIAPDLLGFGRTERRQGIEYGMQAWTAHIVGVLDALGCERAHVVGHSFGGSLALALAINNPERVDRLVLTSAVGVSFPLTAGLDAVWGYQPSLESMRAIMGVFAYDSHIDEDLVRMRYESSIAPGVQEAYTTMFPAPRQITLDAVCHDPALVAKVPHPTLIVHGRDDRVIPFASSLRLFDLIGDSRLQGFSRSGHLVQIDHAADYNATLRAFLLDRGE